MVFRKTVLKMLPAMASLSGRTDKTYGPLPRVCIFKKNLFNYTTFKSKVKCEKKLHFYFTVTRQTAFFFPLFTVIFAVPFFFPVTMTFVVIVATFLLELVSVILSVLVTGFTKISSFTLLPRFRLSLVADNFKLLVETFFFTVTLHFARIPLLSVTVITAFPVFFAVSLPVAELTETTLGLLEL